MSKKKILFTFLVSLFSLAVVFVGTYYVVKMRQTPNKSSAGSGVSLYFDPANPMLGLNSNFTLNVKVNPGSEKVTAAELYLTFDKNMIQITSIDSVPAFSAGAAPKTFLKDPVIDNNQGTVSVIVGVLPEVPVGSVSDVVIIKGKTKNVPGDTLITISQDSKAAAIDKTTNVIESYGEASLNITFPPVNGGWTDWGACSVTACGSTGTQTRSCTNPSPQYGGSDCSSLDGGNSSKACSTAACPINGGWTDWSPASCPTACDLPASSQTRTCTNPTPANGGADCAGLATSACAATGSCLCGEPAAETQNLNCPDSYSGSIAQIRTKSAYPACAWGDWVTTSDTCTLVNTPVNGGWSGWNPTSCPTDCGLAESTQTRMCNNPTPANGGADCAGLATSACAATAGCVEPTANPTATPTGSAKIGDVNGDNQVNIVDIGIIIDNYGDNPANPKADINGDGKANIVDIGIIIDNYNK